MIEKERSKDEFLQEVRISFGFDWSSRQSVGNFLSSRGETNSSKEGLFSKRTTLGLVKFRY